MTEFSVFEYRVFLSYSDRDKAWATWLQEALEAYRIDPDLVGRETPAGLVRPRCGRSSAIASRWRSMTR